MLEYRLQDNISLRLLMRHHARQLSQTIVQNAEHISRFLDFATPKYDEAMARSFIEAQLHQLAKWRGITFGIFQQNDLIGLISAGDLNFTARRCELGYWLAQDWQGYGIMTDAVRALTNYAIKTLGFNRVEISMDVRNARSEAIPQRLGFEFEGIREQWRRQHGRSQDSKYYVMLADNWEDTNFKPNTDLLRQDLGDGIEIGLLLPNHVPQYSKLVRESYNFLEPWLPWVTSDYSDEDARGMVNRFLNKLADNSGMPVAMFYNNAFAGWAAYLYWNWNGLRTELGYWLGQKFVGRGIVTRTVQAMTRFAINDLGINRLDILTDIENDPSGRVALRAGYKHEAVRRQFVMRQGKPLDMNVYVMLAENWHDGR
jgi:ribosomal-protein-serine acetyltransferase